jgi:S1-C subfamily serine protease
MTNYKLRARPFAGLPRDAKTRGVWRQAPLQFSRFMYLHRFFKGLCALAFLAAGVSAQDAQSIIDATAKVYRDAYAYAGQVDTRTIYFVFAPTIEGQAPRYDVRSTQLKRLDLKVRKPQGYWLATLSTQEGFPIGLDHPEMRMNMVRSGGASWSVLARTENGQAKQGIYTSGKFVAQDIPPEQFNRQAASRLGSRIAEDLVLRNFPITDEVQQGTLPLGLLEPALIGRESYNGRSVFRLTAKTSSGGEMMLWVEEGTSFILRSILQLSSSTSMNPAVKTNGRMVTVVESLYNNQRLNPSFSSADFMIGTPPTNSKLNADQMGFCGVAQLVTLAVIAPSAGGDTTLPGTGSEAVAEGDPAPAPAPVPATPAEPEAQALSYEQMSGIVLIDGDGGTATGFMTKIRDVDFVVTNLHVLVGNKKISLKTLRGEEIPYQGIFGAVGGDIAIIRIAKGEGVLKLATDVFQSSKIGDKVVVVGNRRGGGVATQTNGNIKGIGPKLIEVDANFQPGNSGSPIVNLGTNEVVGVATYSETRRVEVEENGRASGSNNNSNAAPEVEKRWFGYRLDSVSKWEAIDLAKWNAQGERIDKFRETSEALLAIIKFDFKNARQHPRLTTILDGFEARYRAAGQSSITAATEVKDLFRVVRSISDDGVKDLTSGDYYDYYRTCQYWENSITAQLEFRNRIIEVLKKYEANSNLYLSRMRSGG